jgi:hypothetical protein
LVQSALQRYLDPQKLSIVKAGDFARMADGATSAAKPN